MASRSRRSSAASTSAGSTASSRRRKAARWSTRGTRRQQAERRQDAGIRRHDDRAEAELRSPGGTRGAGPAPPNASRSNPAGSRPRRTVISRVACDHRGVGDLDDRDGGLERSRRRGVPASRAIAASAAADVQRQPAAGEWCRADPAQHDVRVGDGRLGPAAAVAGGAGIGARALRPDAQDPAGVDPGDAAAARADLDEVHDGAEDRQPARVRDGRARARCRARAPSPGSGASRRARSCRPSPSCRPCRG